jgi:hypothetical protein
VSRLVINLMRVIDATAGGYSTSWRYLTPCNASGAGGGEAGGGERLIKDKKRQADTLSGAELGSHASGGQHGDCHGAHEQREPPTVEKILGDVRGLSLADKKEVRGLGFRI